MKIKQILWQHEESQIPFGEKYEWVEGYIGDRLLFVYHERDGEWYLNAGPTLMDQKVRCNSDQDCIDLAVEILTSFVKDMIEEAEPNENSED